MAIKQQVEIALNKYKTDTLPYVIAADYLRLAGEREDVEKQAAHIRELKRDWDSYGAAPIAEPAIESALKCLASAPHLTPRHNGGVQIDWASGAEISFEPNGDQELDEIATHYREVVGVLEDENLRLAGEVERLNLINSIPHQWASQLETQRQIISSLEAALAVAREDSGRLDWLESECDELTVFRDVSAGCKAVLEYCHTDTGCPADGIARDSIRAAIDDARALAALEGK